MARRKHNAAVKRKLIAKGNNNVKMDRNADLKSYAGKEIRANLKVQGYSISYAVFRQRKSIVALQRSEWK